jgi:hypothetical protein
MMRHIAETTATPETNDNCKRIGAREETESGGNDGEVVV